MSKKYYVLLISLAVFLVISIVTIGFLTNKLWDKKSNEDYYELGEIKIQTIEKVTNAELDLVNYSYNNDGGLSYIKTYKYDATDITVTLSDYNEYLMLEQNFSEVVAFDLSLEEGSYTLTKEVNDKLDICDIIITYTAKTIQIELIYTYTET